MILEIITPDEKVFSGEIVSVNLPGSNGSFEVLANHAPLISTLQKGNVKINIEKGQEKSLLIDGGLAEVLNNKVIVLAEAVIG
ncbi:MAG: ATP synthase F1 subunit epsilon [Cytophagaceae bacterium]